MNIKELSTTEIKALLYDLATDVNRINHNMKMLKEELERRAQEAVKETSEEEPGVE